MYKIHSILLIIVFLLLSGCAQKTIKPATKPTLTNNNIKAGPPVLIYKTKKDYFHHVPVILSADKKQIVSFPAIQDIYFQGQLALPTRLENGFLLDNRGISKDAAFLSDTYEEYCKLKETPSPDELFSRIIDPDPITELYRCGIRYDYEIIEEELNFLIRKGNFTKFEKIK